MEGILCTLPAGHKPLQAACGSKPSRASNIGLGWLELMEAHLTPLSFLNFLALRSIWRHFGAIIGSSERLAALDLNCERPIAPSVVPFAAFGSPMTIHH